MLYSLPLYLIHNKIKTVYLDHFLSTLNIKNLLALIFAKALILKFVPGASSRSEVISCNNFYS